MSSLLFTIPKMPNAECKRRFPTRHEVDLANTMRMKNLSGEGFVFEARDGGTIQDKAQRDRLLSNCMAPPKLELKKGAQVMLIKNIDETLVNGSLGMVMAFMDGQAYERYLDNEDDFQAGHATTSDGEGPQKPPKATVTPQLVSETVGRWPVVRFSIADGTFREIMCPPETWNIELPNGEVQASRAQVPLILAWALSIHKAQGQTLERVKVDLGRVFEKGQAYVALSRATCQEGLQVLRFDPRKVMAHDRVRSFYKSLSSVEEAAKKTSKKSVDKKEKANEKKEVAVVKPERSYEQQIMDEDFCQDAEEVMGWN